MLIVCRSSNRKRSYPYGSQASSQVSGSQYAQLSRSPSKRQRSEESQYGGYSRNMDPSSGYGGMPNSYNSPTTGSRLQPPGALLNNRNRWSMYGNDAGNSPQQQSSDMSFRSTSLPRLDPSLTAGQPSTGVLPQGTVQQNSAAGSSINPSSAGSYPHQPFSYSNVGATGSYPSYGQAAGYAHPSTMYSNEHAVPQQYPDPSQGYPSGYDSTNANRSGYQVPSSRGWS